jgi:3-hydroxybutyryl-CoA dehydrogenase
MSQLKKVGVVGAGTMGVGIAELCAEKGFRVALYDSDPAAAKRAADRVKTGLAHGVSRGKITQEAADKAFAAISYPTSFEGLSDCDIVVEAASEDIRIKQRIFKDLGKLGEETVLATNTSSLPVWTMAQAARHPARVVGMHFFNPPVVMKLVEVAKTAHTEDSYFKRAWDFALALGKTPIEVKDTPGFVVNRVFRPYYLRGLRMANEGAAIESIDEAARTVGKAPMGPFELMDLIGVDVNYAITKVIYESLGRPERLRPSPMQEWLINSGNTGRKVGRGFYLYKEGEPRRINPELMAVMPEPKTLDPRSIWVRLMSGIAEEAQRAFEEGVATKDAIDTAICLATNLPQGPFAWQKEISGRN